LVTHSPQNFYQNQNAPVVIRSERERERERERKRERERERERESATKSEIKFQWARCRCVSFKNYGNRFVLIRASVNHIRAIRFVVVEMQNRRVSRTYHARPTLTISARRIPSTTSTGTLVFSMTGSQVIISIYGSCTRARQRHFKPGLQERYGYAKRPPAT